jgi:hypothetical protein
MDFDDASVFTTLLSNTAAEKIRKHTSAQLVKDGRHPIADTLELYQFIATLFIRSRFRVTTSLFYSKMASSQEQQHNIKLMPEERYTHILNSLRGYDISARRGDDTMKDIWMQRKTQLRQFEDLEKLMFEPTNELLLNKKSGELVLDDELIGSRAGDGAIHKKLSERKSGREGPVADAIACAHSGILHQMRLRVTGEKELDNVAAMFDRMLDARSVSHDLACKFDRGYGKEVGC